MTAKPDLSIVIVTYECRPYVLDLLGDLAAARDALSLEVFVVDNASTDGTVDAIRAAHLWIDVDAQAENVGFGKANNRAIPRAQADTILLLNPDTRVTAEALTACVDELRRCPDVGILTPRVVDEHGVFDRRCMRGFPTLWGVFCHVTKLDKVLRDRASGRYLQRWLSETDPADVESVSGAVMFARADALAQVGGFDERFFMYGEDIDLCLRIADAGWRVRYCPGVEITHLGGRAGENPVAQRAWSQALGELQRSHRPGKRGLMTALAFDRTGSAVTSRRWQRTRRVGPRPPR
jgi:GT2 family glycosyltransferase